MASPLQTLEVPEDALSHTPLEDAQGLGIGVLLCALGTVLLTHLGFITGQTAGLALVIAYATGWSFGPVFFAVNLPFYVFAWLRLGPEFTLKTFGAVTLLALLAELMPGWMSLGPVNPIFGAVLIGAVLAVGLLAVFRHGGSLGGLGVVALYVQDKTGFRAGWVQLGFDIALFAVAFLLFPATIVFYSLLGAVVLNVLIAINHRRDRYIAR
ncbi:MAG: YitT family protein [Paracoccaceae bacterium]|nr:YitT family protein [Paracoccaceae bacterium]